jgi:tetratricopeptide (TPR) repeat protein
LPNDPRPFEITGYIRRRQGRSEEILPNLTRALELDPRNFFILQQTALTYANLHRYAEGVATLDRALSIKPGDPETEAARGMVELDWKAETQMLRDAIDQIRAREPGAIKNVSDYWFNLALAERNAADASEALKALGENYLTTDAIELSRHFCEGLLARMTKDHEKALGAFDAALGEQEKRVQAQPDYGPTLCVLALIHAGLGRKEEALRESQRAVELLPVEKDSVNGFHMIEYSAVAAAWVGENKLACEQLTRANSLPGYGINTYGQLKLRPFWDPLRGDPRFEKIVASAAPKVPPK